MNDFILMNGKLDYVNPAIQSLINMPDPLIKKRKISNYHQKEPTQTKKIKRKRVNNMAKAASFLVSEHEGNHIHYTSNILKWNILRNYH